MTDDEFTEQLIALARRKYGERHSNEALMIGIQNTLTLALAHGRCRFRWRGAG